MAPELEIDFDSDAWKVIKAYAEKQLNSQRLTNDSSANDALATAAIRGRIAVWKELLGLPEKREKALQEAGSASGFNGY